VSSRGLFWIVTLSGLSMAAPLLTQEWAGVERLQGRVLDLDDQPIVGAVVTLRSVESSGMAPEPVATDGNGRWLIGGLAASRWEITVKAKGYRTSLGWIETHHGGPDTPLTVWMRPLAEVTPSFAENRQSVIGFIEMGNDLLEQGHYSRARQEYGKALAALPAESQPEILRAVARTHFLQNEIEETILTLRQALAMAPADPTTRQLFRSVLEQQGRLAEAENLLAALDRGEEIDRAGSLGESREGAISNPTAPRQLPLETLSADRNGRFRARLSKLSPASDLATVLERLGVDPQYLDGEQGDRGQYSLAEESFQVYVPPAPPSPSGYGLLVWISPTPFGGFVREEIGELLDQHGLVWIGADNAGNVRPSWFRVMLALDAVHNLAATYPIDDQRIYAAGYSGGGRITSSLAQLYPEVFRGGISLFGCDYMDKLPIPFKPGAHWPAAYPPPPRERSRSLKKEGRFVLITGELDFNRAQTKATYERMLADGFENVAALVIPGASHYHRVEMNWLDQSLEFLDGGARPQGPGWSTVD